MADCQQATTLDAYWEEAIGKVSFDEDLHGFLNGLMGLRQLPESRRRKHAAFHRWINTGFVPAPMREALDLEWSSEDEERCRTKLAKVGRRNRRVPRQVRNFPMNLYLWDFRVRRALGKPIA